MRSKGGWLAAGVALGLAAGAAPARADLIRIEAVGVVPAREQAAQGTTPRAAALRAGLRAAVLRAALELAREEGGWTERDDVAQALGADPYPYTSRFRLLEDRGERPRGLLEGEKGAWEYEVLVEAYVERDRVRERLAKAGLLAPRPASASRGTLRVAVEGLQSYASYRSLRDALARRARAVHPLEFARGRAVLAVQTDRAPLELLDALRRELPAGLEVVPLALEDGELRLRLVERGAERAPAGLGAATPAPGWPREGRSQAHRGREPSLGEESARPPWRD